jgi:hypothetical protein
MNRAIARQLLDALPEPTLVPYEESDRMNSVRNNGPGSSCFVGN